MSVTEDKLSLAQMLRSVFERVKTILDEEKMLVSMQFCNVLNKLFFFRVIITCNILVKNQLSSAGTISENPDQNNNCLNHF